MGGRATRAPSPVVGEQEGTQAPGDLAVVEAFVNTRDVEAGTDVMTAPAALAQWLSAHRLLPSGEATVRMSDLHRVVEVREALRDLLLANHDDVAAPSEALAVLDREARLCPVAIDVSEVDHAHLRPTGGGIDGALATLLAIVFHAMHDGTWRRLKACREDSCRWAFYDSSRNRSGRWCSMAVCGNRNKVASYRLRQQ